MTSADGLDFEDDLAGHDQVHAVRIVDELPSVRNRQRNLAFEGNPSSLKLDSQARLVGRFEEPRPAAASPPPDALLRGPRCPLWWIRSFGL